jgi:hypothetical protein
VEALRAANALREPPQRPLGRSELSLPDGAPLEHRVLEGHTLWRVAAWYGHSLGEIERANTIDDPDRILAGARLRIPPGARTGCPPPAALRAVAPARVAVAAPPPPARPRPAPPAAPLPEQPPAPPAPSPQLLARADQQLERASALYDAADFGAVVARARSARELLAAQPQHPAVAERRAQAAWLAGLAHAGLDERESAVRELRAALELRPALRDDPRLSPRIASLLEDPPAEWLAETPR